MEIEDPDLEDCEIEEYASSSKRSNTKMGWILNKALWLGKKAVVTGIVITSAPLVLPPLVVFSTFGFAFSVPSGLVFASYACTEKLMSKLLPSPTSSPELEYGSLYSDEEQEEEDADYILEGVLEEEEREQMEDIKRGLEARTKLDEEGYKELKGGDHIYQEKNMGETIKDEGYKEDVGEYLDMEDAEPSEVVVMREDENERNPVLGESKDEAMLAEVREVMVVIEGNDKDRGNTVGVEESDMVAKRRVGETGHDEEEIVRGSTGLLEKIRDIGIAGDSLKHDNRDAKELPATVDGESEKKSEGIEKPFEEKNPEVGEVCVEMKVADGQNGDATISRGNEGSTKLTGQPLEKLVGEVKGTDGNKRDVMISDADEGITAQVDKPYEKKNVKLGKPFGKKKGRRGERKNEKVSERFGQIGDARIEENMPRASNEVKQVGEMGSIVDGNRDANNANNFEEAKVRKGDQNRMVKCNTLEGIVEQQVPVVSKEATIREDTNFSKKEENMMSSNADATRRAEGSGFHLISGDQISSTASNNLEENGNSDAEEHADSLELKVSGGVAKLKTDVALPFNKESANDKKIWEEINAMRSIVGYKAAPHKTCIGEVKALYIFTGVELPPSLKDDCDFAEVAHKLRLLMSIVGVK